MARIGFERWVVTGHPRKFQLLSASDLRFNWSHADLASREPSKVGEEPAVTAAREVEEETGWRPRNVRPLVSLQPMVGSADAENLLFIADGADYLGLPEDVNEAERVAWIPLASVPERLAAGEIVGAASLVGLLHVLAFPPSRPV